MFFRARVPILIVVITSLLAGFAPVNVAMSAAAQSLATAPADERIELTSLRTERSKIFLEADGSRAGRFFTGPVHFRAADGSWQEVDTHLVPSSRPGYAWRNAAGAFTVDFAATARSEGMVVVSDATSSIGFGLAGANPTSVAAVSGSKVTYPSIKPGIDLVYEVRNGEVKEEIVLQHAPMAPLVLDFPLTLENLTAQEVGSGALNLVTASGDLGFRVSDVWMVDSARQLTSGEPAFSEDLVSSLTGVVGNQTLRVVPSHEWLTAPERVYPVTIDPTTTKTTNDDTYVQSNILNTDVSGENEMKSGTYDSGTTKARTLMKFADVQNQVPSGASITGAKLFVYEFHSFSCTPRDVSVHRITDPWDGNSVRWSNQPGVAAAATTVSVAKGYSASCGAGWVTFDTLGSMVQYWKANNNNYGIEIRSPNEINSDWWKKWRPLGSGNAPYLEVYYTDPDITGPGAPTISSSSHPSSSTWYSNSSPSFNWTTPSDPSGIEGYSVKLDQVSNTFPDNAIDVFGNSTSYGTQTSGEWWFHVRAKDGAGNWAPSDAGHYKIRIDTVPTSTPAVSSSTHPSQTAWSASNDPCVSWSSSDSHSGIAGYSYELTTNAGATPDTTIDTSGTSTCFTNYADGTWYFRIHAKDNAGNWSSVGNYTIKIDEVPATPSISSSTHPSPDTWYANQNPSFSWSASDESGIAGYSYVLTTSSSTTPDITSEGAGTSTAYSGLADGDWWFHARAQNGAGVWGTAAHRRVRIDISPAPPPSLTSSTHPSQSVWSTNNDPSFSFSTSDLSGITGYSFTLDQTPATVPDSVVDSASGSTSYSDVGDGTRYFHVRAQNRSGLWSATVHYQVNIDTAPPAVPVIASSTHPNEALTYASNDPAFSWTASDSRSGIAGYSYALDQFATTTPDTTSEGLTSTKSYSDLADGVWWFHVRAKDQAGNWGDPSHYQISIDVPAPNVTVTLAAPAGQTDQAGRQVVKDGDTLTFGGTITEGSAPGSPLDPSASVVTCELVSLASDGTEVQRLGVPLANCRNEGGQIQGSFTPGSLSATRGTLRLEVIARRGVESSARAFSSDLQVDNDVPHVVEAAIGCLDPTISGVCADERAVTVELNEFVRGDVRATDFSVPGNVVLNAEHTCTQQTFCYRVTLTTAGDVSLTSPPQVSYSAPAASAVSAPPRDAVGHGLPSFSTASVNKNTTYTSRGVIEGRPDPNGEIAVLPASPVGQIVMITVNATQTCENCENDVFEPRLARRVMQLGEKATTGIGGDGMGNVAPDLVLLQEADCSDATNIAAELNGRIEVDGETEPNPYMIGGCATDPKYRVDGNGDGDTKDPVDPEYVADTPILFNRHTMWWARYGAAGDSGAYFPTKYSRSDRPADCAESPSADKCEMKYKLSLAMSFVETQGVGSKTVAVVNTHLVNDFRLKDGEHNRIVTGWLTGTKGLVTRLEERYETAAADYISRYRTPAPDYFAVAGDLNISRCPKRETDPHNIERDEASTCGGRTARGWWTALSSARGYSDAIFATHSTDAGMHDQYKDGCKVIGSDGTCDQQGFRAHRIDYVFAKAVSPTPVLRASFDLTCGQRASANFEPNCNGDSGNPGRYSDHRLQWAVLGAAPPPVTVP